MAVDLHILGVRHHGPGSARSVLRALEAIRPEAVLIEGPPDAHDVLSLAADEAMRPPVALLIYEESTPRNSVYYPFAEFSPEWQAIRWGLAHGAAVKFIDLPVANHQREEQNDLAQQATGDEESSNEGSAPPKTTATADEPTADTQQAEQLREDPLNALARAAGEEDGERWWNRLVEENRGSGDDVLGVFGVILEAMAAARAESPKREDPEEDRRESHMRRSIRSAMREGYKTIAVVCGAWHAPVLTSDAITSITAKADDAVLKNLPKRKMAATWIPWTNDRLASRSGYGAGVYSPGWYEHLWTHRTHVSERWMTRVARLMRDQGLDASPASVIEAARLAETLAAVRGRVIAGLEELGEATLAVLCHANTAPLRVIHDKLIVGDRLGEVPESAPTVPLARDLAAQQKSLRLKQTTEDQLLELDQRKEMDLARSHLLHRLNLLDVEWGHVENDQRRSRGTFREVWRLRWKPEFAVAIIEAARWGSTVAEAAAAKIRDTARRGEDIAKLSELLDDAILADLPDAVETLTARIRDVAAVAADVARLMDALPSMTRVLRYGNVRQTDAAMVEPIVTGFVVRICAGLGPACASLDDDAAARMRTRIDGVNAALQTLDDDTLLEAWRDRLKSLGDSPIHGLVAGRCWRLLLDAHQTETQTVASTLGLALSRGEDPAKAAAWLEGFLSGSGTILVHDPQLLGIVNAWVCSLPAQSFEELCPIVRRTFSTFEKPERRRIGERIKKETLGTIAASAAPTSTHDYNAQRGELVMPVLRLILGEEIA